MNTVTKILLVSRPISWPNTSYPFAAAYLLTGGELNLFFMLTTFFFIFPYNLLMYGVNDIFDYESDIKNPRKGGIEGMREQRAFHPVIARAVAITTIPFVLYIFINGAVVSNLIFVCLMFTVVAYSAKYLRFKERPFLDSATSSSHFVGPMIFGLSLTNSLQENWPLVLAFFFWGMASHALGAIQDIIPDRKAKIGSIATVLGAQKTLWFVFVFYLLCTSILLTQSLPVLLVGLCSVPYIFNLIDIRLVQDKNSHTANKAWRRFLWINYLVGFFITLICIVSVLK